MSKYSLWNPFLISAYHDPRTFKDDSSDSSDSGSDNDGGNQGSSTPTFNSLAEASEAGYHGQAVNIAGAGLQKVEFADDSYNETMAARSDAANAGDSGSAASTTTAASTSSRDDGGSSNIVETVASTAADVVNNIGNDLAMGLGLIEKDQDFIDRTAATIERTQGSDAASRYAAGQVDNGFEDNYNAGTTAAATTQTDYSDAGTFSEAFADARENLGPGQTFTYDGASYSTAITGEDPALDAAIAAQAASQEEAAAPGYATMGVGEAGRGENVGYVAPQDTSVSLATETDLMSQPVVTQESQDYLDTLGTFEFDPDDFQTTTTQPSDPDASDPRGDQIESPTGTGIGQASTSVTDIQDTLDQIGGATGTTIEDLLPSNATADVGLDNMNFQERIERQTELAEADPGGQSTATGTLLSDGSTVDTLVTTDPETGRPATFEATTVAGEDPVINKITYSDAQGNTFDTLAEAQLSDAQELFRQSTQLQNIPTQTDYTAQPQVIQAGLSLPSLSDIGSGLSTAYDSIMGAFNDFDQSRKSVDQINRENEAAYEAEAFGPFGRDPATGQATPFETLPDGTIIRQGANTMEGLGTVGVGLQDLSGLIGSGLYSAGEFFGKPTVTEREGQLPLIGPAEDNFLKQAGTTMMDTADILGNRAFEGLSEEAQSNLSRPVFPEEGGVDLSALGAKTVRTLPSAGAALINPLLAGGLTVGDVGLASDDVIDAAVADGTLSGLGQGEIQALKDEARRTNTIPSALIGTVSNLLPGRLGQNLLQRMGVSAGEEFVQEGVFEPNIAQTSASTAGGFDNQFQFDPEAGTIGALASGTSSVATRGTAPNQATDGGPSAMTGGPDAPVSPAAGVISGQSLAPSTQTDVTVNTAQPTAVQPVSPEQVPSVINIPGTDVVVQQVSPAQPPAPTDAAPSGLAALGTGGAFQLPTTGNVPQLPAPSNVDAQPSVDQTQPSQPEVMSQAPEGLTASEILQNEIDIITTDTNTSADQASQGPASIALIEAARNEGADVNVGDSRADVASKIVNQTTTAQNRDVQQKALELAQGNVDPSLSAVTLQQEFNLSPQEATRQVSTARQLFRDSGNDQNLVMADFEGGPSVSNQDAIRNRDIQQASLELAQAGVDAPLAEASLQQQFGLTPQEASREVSIGRQLNRDNPEGDLVIADFARDTPFSGAIIPNQVASDNQAAAEEAMGRVDIGRINQPAAPESLPNIDLTPPAAPETPSMTPSDVDISRINQPQGLPEGIGSLDAAVSAMQQNLSPQGIISLEVAQTGALSNETAQKVAQDNNLSMQEVASTLR